MRPEIIGYRPGGIPMHWDENLLHGETVTCKSKTLHDHTAWLARQRLREIIAADRAAVPCGRWVEIECEWPSALLAGLKDRPKEWKTRYRYEIRR